MTKTKFKIIDKENDRQVDYVTTKNYQAVKTRASYAFPDSKCVWIVSNKGELLFTRVAGKWESEDVFKW